MEKTIEIEYCILCDIKTIHNEAGRCLLCGNSLETQIRVLKIYEETI